MSADDDVVGAAKRGDPDAWRELYRAHAGRLLLWLQRGSSGDSAVAAEDIAAEAWLTAASKVADFRGDSGEFAGWLFGIARHVEANVRRRSGRRQTDPVEALPHEPVPAHEATLVEQDWITAAIATLPARERDVVTCIDVLGLDAHGAATALGISPVAVRVARHRGLKRLREALSGQ